MPNAIEIPKHITAKRQYRYDRKNALRKWLLRNGAATKLNIFELNWQWSEHFGIGEHPTTKKCVVVLIHPALDQKPKPLYIATSTHVELGGKMQEIDFHLDLIEKPY